MIWLLSFLRFMNIKWNNTQYGHQRCRKRYQAEPYVCTKQAMLNPCEEIPLGLPKYYQIETTEEVKKMVAMVNEATVPSQDVVEVVVSPPYVFLGLVQTTLRPDIHVAAQNCWVNEGGDFTGEISAEMLVNISIPWVILGHSERRLNLNESNEFVGEKVAYALSKGLKVIACVGETLAQMESGSTMDVVIAQTKAIADHVSDWADVVLAYEPVWAIETGKLVSPAQAQKVHFELRKWLKENTTPELSSTIRIIYGGSVSGANCKELAGKPDVDGFLVDEACREDISTLKYQYFPPYLGLFVVRHACT